MQVIKKDGTLDPYTDQKIINAVGLAAQRALVSLTDDDYAKICERVFEVVNEEDFYNEDYQDELIPVQDMHVIVEKVLMELVPKVGECYRQYRNYKQDFVKMLNKVYEESQKIMYIGDKENSNTDSALVSTKRSLVFNQLNKELYQKFFMTIEEIQACRDGYIYTHDMSARRDTMNCCLFDVKNVLTDGFEMGNVWYNEPKTLDVAFDVIGDIVLSAAAQQYGGFTVPHIDEILEPYAEKSYKKYYEKYIALGIDEKRAEAEALKDVEKEMEQGFQGLEYKFNTVSSSRGDYPFVTITFGLTTSKFGKMASITCLKVRKNGQGKEGFKKPVLFPKLVFLYDESLHGKGMVNEDVFEAGIECSAKTMYPDWLSLTGNGYVASIYKKYGKVISPMGKCKL